MTITMIKLNRADSTSIIGMLDAVQHCGVAMEFPRAQELFNEAERLIRIIEKQL